MKKPTLYLAAVATLALAPLSHAATTYTWISAGGSGQDTDWGNTANWDGGLVPVDAITEGDYHEGLSFVRDSGDKVVFNGTVGPSNFSGIGGSYDSDLADRTDTPIMEFNSGGTFNFTMKGRDEAVWFQNAGSQTVWTVGDGIGGETEDVILNISASKTIGLSRHADGVTNTYQVLSDGALTFNQGLDFQYSDRNNRNSIFSIDGGSVSSTGSINYLLDNLSYVEFTAAGGSFSAAYGGSYSTLTDIQTAVSTNDAWEASSGLSLQVTDNGTGFTVTAVPEPSSTALLGLGGLALLLRRRK